MHEGCAYTVDVPAVVVLSTDKHSMQCTTVAGLPSCCTSRLLSILVVLNDVAMYGERASVICTHCAQRNKRALVSEILV
jgi:hypothetical protein